METTLDGPQPNPSTFAVENRREAFDLEVDFRGGAVKTWQVRAEIRPWEEGGYLAEVPALQGCWVVADTVEEAIQDLHEVIVMSITSRLTHGEPIPPDVRQVVAGSGPIEVEIAVAVP